MNSEFTSKLSEVLSKSRIETLAKESKYYVKSNRAVIDAYAFLVSNLRVCIVYVHYSLFNITSYLKDNFSIEVSKQGLSQRYNACSVAFVQLVLAELHKTLYLEGNLPKLVHFSAIRILDSTNFQLPEKFQTHYQGVGGSSSKAGIKIQQEIDLLGNSYYPVHLHSSKEHDNKYKDLHEIKANELIIRDLGYWDTNYLDKIHQKGAYFLSRFHYNTQTIWLKDAQGQWQSLGVNELLKAFLRSKRQTKRLFVYLGNHKTPVRLMIQRLPDEVVEQRLREKQKKHRKPLDATYKLFNKVNMYVTNTEESQLSDEDIWTIYRVRWQIELLFKTWKSYYHIDHYKDMSVERFEILLFCKLIWITMAYRTYVIAQTTQLTHIKEKKAENLISLMKVMKEFRINRIELFLDALTNQKQEAIQKHLENFYDYISEKAIVEVKKSKICALRHCFLSFA
jgi:hypothetical protein